MGKHTGDRQFHCLFRTGLHQFFVGNLFQMANIAGVSVPLLLNQLVACQDSVFCVDDDDILTAVNARGVLGTVLASENRRGLGVDTAQRFASGVIVIPFLLYFFGFRHVS